MSEKCYNWILCPPDVVRLFYGADQTAYSVFREYVFNRKVVFYYAQFKDEKIDGHPYGEESGAKVVCLEHCAKNLAEAGDGLLDIIKATIPEVYNDAVDLVRKEGL